MDLATLIGLVFGTIVILLAIISGGDIGIFINIPGLLVVLGGTIAATLIADKLQIRSQYDRKTKSLIVEGVLGIAQGESPHVIDEILGTYLQEAGGPPAAESEAAAA